MNIYLETLQIVGACGGKDYISPKNSTKPRI